MQATAEGERRVSIYCLCPKGCYKPVHCWLAGQLYVFIIRVGRCFFITSYLVARERRNGAPILFHCHSDPSATLQFVLSDITFRPSRSEIIEQYIQQGELREVPVIINITIINLKVT